MSKVYLIDAVRTPVGSFGGALRNVSAEDMATLVIKALLERNAVPANAIDSVIMGQTRQNSQANNLARVASLKATVSMTASAYTINMLCGSGMKAIALGAAEIMLGNAEIVVAGGTENMSQTPYYLRGARFGEGTVELIDANIEGGLGAVPRSIYGNSLSMGVTAENVARRFAISREDQDQFAYDSQVKCGRAILADKFRDEIVPVEIETKRGKNLVASDEFPRPETTLEKLAALRPAFAKDGSVTAGNSCGRNDGASALLLLSEAMVKKLRLSPLARLVACCDTGVDPEIMGIGPIPAVRKLLVRAGIAMDQIDLFELNEAFSSQALACIRELGLDSQKVNPLGGAIALGHPLGCTGARLVTTLVHQLKHNGRYGIATQCIGGGQGIASLWEKA